MKNCFNVVLAMSFLALGAMGAFGATTINLTHRDAWGANIGWMDWRGEGANGAVIGEYVCAGFVYAANIGWIHLGDGAPVNGIAYQNDAGTDFGVNHDGTGNLRGLAYGANIGWLNFEATGHPRVDLITGQLSGFVYGANVGWISLSNAEAHVQTDHLQMGPDTDGDGLVDAWELQRTGDLSTLASVDADNDGDGLTNGQEYRADTDPTDASSFLRIVAWTVAAGGSSASVTWTSRPTRLYRVQGRDDLGAGGQWSDIGLGLITPSLEGSTTRMFGNPPVSMKYFRIEGLKPLDP